MFALMRLRNIQLGNEFMREVSLFRLLDMLGRVFFP